MYIDDADAASRAVLLVLAKTEFVNTFSHETDLVGRKLYSGKIDRESKLPNWWFLNGSETRSEVADDGGGGDATKVNGVNDNGFSLVAIGEILGRVLWSNRS